VSVTDGQAASNGLVLHANTNTEKLIWRGTYSIKEFVKQSNMTTMKALFFPVQTLCLYNIRRHDRVIYILTKVL